MHYGFLDLIFYQTTSISPPWVPGVSKNREEPTELDFRVFGCNHEVLEKLEAKNLLKVAKFVQKCLNFRRFWLLAPLKLHGCTQTP